MVGTTTASMFGEASAAASDSNRELLRKQLIPSSKSPWSMMSPNDTSSSPPPVNLAVANSGGSQ